MSKPAVTVIPQPQKMVHIHLGKDHDGTQKINLLAPFNPEIKKLKCILYPDNQGTPIEAIADYKNEIVRLFSFEFGSLIDGMTYEYRFYNEGSLIPLGPGLELKDLRFEYWKTFKQDDTLIHMSCNGVFDFENGSKKWDMWTRLADDLANQIVRPKLIILGGDQYYQDLVERLWFAKVTAATNFEQIKPEFIKASLSNALLHWEHPAYRKIMASHVSFAMLDDHDITDGAGGERPEFYNGLEFTEGYKRFSSVQKELFELLQASRNPTPLHPKPNNSFSFIYEMGDAAFVALDLRTEKNSRKHELQSTETKEAIFKGIRNLKQKNVMILIPVVPVKNSQKVEATALLVAKILSAFDTWKAIGDLQEMVKEKVDTVNDLEDDITDALCSEQNKDYLFGLLEVLMEGSIKGVNYTILSGDIHTAGTVEMHLERNGQYTVIPILISSPIGYEPMNYMVEALLREKKLLTMEHKGINLKAVNHAFSCNRNYMIVSPYKLVTEPNEAVMICEEGIPYSRNILVKAWKTPESYQISTKAVIAALNVTETQKTN